MNQDSENIAGEFAEIKKMLSRQSRFDAIVKVLPTVIALVAVIVGFIQYRSTAASDFRKTYWQQQLEIYKRTTQAAAAIALSPKELLSPAHQSTFWQLYWGELAMLEHPEVKDAMVAYGNQLYEVEAGRADPSSLKQLSYKLARTCRLSLKKTWNPADLGDIPESLP